MPKDRERVSESKGPGKQVGNSERTEPAVRASNEVDCRWRGDSSGHGGGGKEAHIG